jgi:DNA polymerase
MARGTPRDGTTGGSTGSAADFIPKDTRLTLPLLREAVQTCRGCDLYQNATQAVFGRGPRSAAVMLVGEQPGDQEDRQGEPFVGPAGHMLDRSLEEAGIERSEVYVTNAVKHFKWEPRGKRRIHSKPSAREFKACRPWLEAELSIVQPQIVVCMGATASQSLLGSAFRLTRHRGEFMEGTGWAPLVTATIHPSAILRAPDDQARELMRRGFVADLRKVAQRMLEPRTKRTAGREAQGGRRPAPETGLFGQPEAPGTRRKSKASSSRSRARPG